MTELERNEDIMSDCDKNKDGKLDTKELTQAMVEWIFKKPKFCF